MTHWGWYWKVKLQHKPKQLCEMLPRLDSFKDLQLVDLHNTGLQQCRVTGPGGNSEQIIIERQQCHFGGFRHFFHCPGCVERMRILYFDHGNKIFRCRKCLNLGYQIQRLRTSERYLWQRGTIEDRLKCKNGSVNKRPRWMKKARFEQFVLRCFQYEHKMEAAIAREIYEYYHIQENQF